MTNVSAAPISTGSKATMPRPWPSSTTYCRPIPRNPAAVVTRSYILLKAKQHEQASAILRTAIEHLKRKKEPPPAVFYLLLAAVENDRPPAATAFDRAIATLDQGLSSPSQRTRAGAGEVLRARRQPANRQRRSSLSRRRPRPSPGAICRVSWSRSTGTKSSTKRPTGCSAICSRHRPSDTNLAAALIQVVSFEAAEAGIANQADRQRRARQ